ncbi:uncharacterized protein B0T23DRAFT_391538 [Neurospora hispaniola]|uniref:Uncharacterized protein n=1 Tax=Neurospora hispaniola TaxID=588809 RepID=A0AAJ0IEB3_9PEZI|nr:hypothetical protein B0T23DRAFT_391538 [Neurospora hispaniola]
MNGLPFNVEVGGIQPATQTVPYIKPCVWEQSDCWKPWTWLSDFEWLEEAMTHQWMRMACDCLRTPQTESLVILMSQKQRVDLWYEVRHRTTRHRRIEVKGDLREPKLTEDDNVTWEHPRDPLALCNLYQYQANEPTRAQVYFDAAESGECFAKAFVVDEDKEVHKVAWQSRAKSRVQSVAKWRVLCPRAFPSWRNWLARQTVNLEAYDAVLGLGGWMGPLFMGMAGLGGPGALWWHFTCLLAMTSFDGASTMNITEQFFFLFIVEIRKKASRGRI